MEDIVISINYLAVLVAAISNMFIGFLWYGPIFGKPWKQMMGFTDDSMKSMPLTAMQAMGLGFIVALIMAYVLAHFVSFLAVTDVMRALQLGFWTWLGFVATTMAGTVLWEGKSVKLYMLNASYYLVALPIMAVILALWA